MNNFLQKKILSQLEEHSQEKIVFWGASKFLKSFLTNPIIEKYNILGIIDNDMKKWNTSFSGYKIFSPDELSNFKSINIIDAVANKYFNNYNRIKEIINTKYQNGNVKLLPNVIHADFDNAACNMNKLEVSKTCEYFVSTQSEIDYFMSLGTEYKQYSEMGDIDRLFLTSLIQRLKPEKILEVGVSKGGSSYLILNAINTYKSGRLYSLDYNTNHYYLTDKKTGFFMDNFPELKKNWTLKTGGLALNFLNEISSATEEKDKFDFCFIDTMHSLPGEILDCLQVLPYIKKDGILVFHDTNWQIRDSRCFVTNMLMSSIQGKKLLPYPKPCPNTLSGKIFFNNIGAIQINENTFSSFYEIFNLLSIPWDYMPKYEDLRDLISFIEKHYSKYFSEYFKEVILLQEKIGRNAEER